jgi:hypothetical protein
MTLGTRTADSSVTDNYPLTLGVHAGFDALPGNYTQTLTFTATD